MRQVCGQLQVQKLGGKVQVIYSINYFRSVVPKTFSKVFSLNILVVWAQKIQHMV